MDLKIRNVPEDQVLVIQRKARKFGVSREEYLRRVIQEKAEEDEFIINENLIIDNIIAIADFSKIQIKVVEILNVSKVDGADKLLKFIIDTGTEKRQIVSGIAKYYTNIEELVGRKKERDGRKGKRKRGSVRRRVRAPS